MHNTMIFFDTAVPHAAYTQQIDYDAPVYINDIICTGKENRLAVCDFSRTSGVTECDFVAVALCEGKHICLRCV